MKFHFKIPFNSIWKFAAFKPKWNRCNSTFSKHDQSSSFFSRINRSGLKPWSFVTISLSLIGVVHVSQTLHSYNQLNTHLLDDVPFSVFLFKLFPLKATSWLWGTIMSLHIPVPFRSIVYSLYAKITGANIEEINEPLSSYASMNDFFIRKLKQNVHIINPDAVLVSPSDGRILGFGTYSLAEKDLKNILINHVKGFKFPLTQFLGEYKDDAPQSEPQSVHSFIAPSSKKLYYCSIYLAPSDYHRFHSPANWTISCMRRVSGEQLPVFPALLKRIPLLYVLNERVPLLGAWKHGRFSMTLVGSTNVGSIKVYGDVDNSLVKSPIVKPWTSNIEILNDANPLVVSKGDELGYFKMGSTVVLVFEAPENFEFSVMEGQAVRMGQKLGQFP